MLYLLASMSVGLRNLPTNETVTRPARRMIWWICWESNPDPPSQFHQPTGKRNRTVMVCQLQTHVQE